jgi:hypothetical protein
MGEVCLDLGEAARFHVPLPSTTHIDRLLPLLGIIYVARAVQRCDPDLKPVRHLANVGFNSERDIPQENP